MTSKPFPPALRRPNQRTRLWGVVLLLGVAALTAMLGLRALQENIIFFYSPAQLQAMDIKPELSFRLGGLVADGSYRRQATDTGQRHFFSLEDGSGRVRVEYDGVLPDLFREGQGIIGLGTWQDNRFVATELLAKHDENYMPREVVDALKETGVWQHDQ